MAKNYVNNESLRLELILSHNRDELTSKCVDMFLLMIEKIQSSFKYVNYQDKEDCASHAMFVILDKWRQFNIDRQNAFAWFTRVIYNGIYAGWNELNKKRAEFSLSNVFIEST